MNLHGKVTQRVILYILLGQLTTLLFAQENATGNIKDRYQYRLIVKFNDEAKIQIPSQEALALARTAESTDLDRLIVKYQIKLARVLRVSEQQVEPLSFKANAASDKKRPDLASVMQVIIEDPKPGDLQQIKEEFDRLPIVDYTFLEPLGVPPPVDIPPVTPNLSTKQNFRGPDPGIDIDYAWTKNAMGAGVRLSIAEYGWNYDHEDLNEIPFHQEPGQTIHPDVQANGWTSHGTAVLGITSAMDNGYGTMGVAPASEVYTYPEWTLEEGYRRVSSIYNAINSSSTGDVVLLEMQTIGPDGKYAPAEYDPTVWLTVKAGVDAGVIVVAAAGNGNADLDAPAYQEYRDRGDSGAILVGAGTSTKNHDKLALSNYGERIDIQSWGSVVFTLGGNGDFATYGGDDDQRYTSSFSGTSSASALVAGAAAAMQSLSKQLHGVPLTPAQMRKLLTDTGHPPGNGGHIGPALNLRAAADRLSAVDGIEVVLASEEVDTTKEYTALSAINAENGFRITNGGDVTLRAGEVIHLRDGFSVDEGGSLKTRLGL